MSNRIVVLGAGTGGTLAANRLRSRYGREDATITVVDQDNRHVYQPGLLFVPFGLASADEIVRPRAEQLHNGIDYVCSPIDHVDIERDVVVLDNSTEFSYDVLIIATGARLVPEETSGLTEAGWKQRVFTFYDLEGASALAGALARFERGRLVVNVVDMPIKCPVAPLEFCFLADWYFHERGVRDDVTITYVTPLDGAFTKPTASKTLGGLLDEKHIELVTEFNTGEVDGTAGKLVSYDAREIPFDLAVVVPLHSGAAYVGRSSGLGDELDFVPTDEHTLQADAKPNVFVLGDAANVPASKAGSVTHFEGEVLVENVAPCRSTARQFLRRACELLHRDRLPQGDADRFQLRPRARSGLLPRARRFAVDARVAREPPRQIDVPVVLLACALARPRRARHRFRDAELREGPHEIWRCLMTTTMVAGYPVEMNEEGFFVDPDEWTEEMAPEIAQQEGITELTDKHWQVIRFMRKEYAEKGTGPTVRVLGKTSGVTVKELYELFPKGPAKTAAKIAGIPKPRGCI